MLLNLFISSEKPSSLIIRVKYGTNCAVDLSPIKNGRIARNESEATHYGYRFNSFWDAKEPGLTQTHIPPIFPRYITGARESMILLKGDELFLPVCLQVYTHLSERNR
uniref:Uncharacterized protein n=1 Tax=Ascaris lumbricoides TaxID=6252 RepID=A0A0M3ICG2_ASCLU